MKTKQDLNAGGSWPAIGATPSMKAVTIIGDYILYLGIEDGRPVYNLVLKSNPEATSELPGTAGYFSLEYVLKLKNLDFQTLRQNVT